MNKPMLFIFALVLAYCIPVVGLPVLVVWAGVKLHKVKRQLQHMFS